VLNLSLPDSNGFSVVKRGQSGISQAHLKGPRGAQFYPVLALVFLFLIFHSFLPGRAGNNRGFDYLFRINFNASTRGKRVLPFPRDYSLGEILISPDPEPTEENALMGAAKGTIVVPAGKFVTFIPSHRFYQNPAIINTLPADGIDCLTLQAVTLDDSEDGLCDRALGYIGHLKGLIVLNLDKSDATDKGAVHAADLPNLQKITAFQSTIEGGFVKQLGGLKQLRYLRLPSSPVKEQNLQYFCTLPHLEHLALSHSAISDEGVKNLAGCSQLIDLDLADCPRITDQSISALLGLKKLRLLNLAGTSITSKGLMRLNALPLACLTLPGNLYLSTQLKAIHAAFPGVNIGGAQFSKKPVDAETNKLFAPLH
jgi:hypothetical protein